MRLVPIKNLLLLQNTIVSVISRIHQKIIQRANITVCPYGLFGIFGIISYPIYYLLWVYVATQGYENLYLRLSISLICIPLALEKYWPLRLRSYLPLYWYITILYCLPFFFTFMLLKNNFSFDWVLNTTTGVTLCILLLDLISLAIILPIGILLAWLAYKLTLPSIHFANLDYSSVVIIYTSIIIFGALFAHRKEKIHQEKLQTMKSLGTSIAHEIRTPLAAIHMAGVGIKEYWPHLVNSYNLAKAHDLPVYPLSGDNYNF